MYLFMAKRFDDFFFGFKPVYRSVLTLYLSLTLEKYHLPECQFNWLFKFLVGLFLFFSFLLTEWNDFLQKTLWR